MKNVIYETGKEIGLEVEAEKINIIVYGIGKRYFELFKDEEFIQKELVQQKIKVVGFTDSDSKIYGKEIIYNNQKFEVKNLDVYSKKDFDRIVITTKQYFYEIKSKLIQKGYDEEKILLIDDFWKEYLDKVYYIEKYINKNGLEIGGPTELFYNIYDKCLSCDNVNFSENTVWIENNTNNFVYRDKVLGSNWIADATDMHQLQDEKYDFILSSNNLEHIANPLKALKEFSRTVKKGGTVLVLVPKKENCFDHDRDYTPFQHLLEDYRSGVKEDDLTHLPEIIEKHDYDMDVACGGKDAFIERAKKNVDNRCLHHHVFEEKCLRKAFEFVGLEVVAFFSVLDNWVIIGEKGKMKK